MLSLPALLKKFDQLTRAHVAIERELAETQQEILAISSRPKASRQRATKQEIVEVVRATVKVLRDAGEALPRREIAARLGIKPWAVSYRLQKAIMMKFVERAGGGRYRCTSIIPLL